MHYHSEALIRELMAKAQVFRLHVLEMVYRSQSGHIGGAFSVAELLAALAAEQVEEVDRSGGVSTFDAEVVPE
jgi:transketolase N-terminal domain/subunit